MPRAVYVLAFAIFTMVTSEFAVAGLMPQMAAGLDATIPQIGYLITIFAAAMAVGGPVATVFLLRMRPNNALLVLFAAFLAGNVLAATAPDYWVMVVARVVTGVASQALFGVSVSATAHLTRPEVRGRALAVVLNGLMLGTLLGLPLATLIGGQLGWRGAFWAVSGLAVIAALCTAVGVPRMAPAGDAGGGLRDELGAFKNARLWLALPTSTLIIGATFAAFSYFNPILTEVSGFSVETVPLLLMAYGLATLVGNTVVGRLADRYTLRVLTAGLALNLVFLTGFALLADISAAAVVFMLGIGLVGVTMNPAMALRVQRTANARPLVNTVHGSFITLGVVLGSWLGGLAIGEFGLRGPLWLGAALAAIGLATLAPALTRRTPASEEPHQPTEPHPVNT
ncbi:putative MFS family arabinose efflux permease [Murinocardiopsis flavida]|uniref:Putative MFS family arabinose efflux permease n=1 Tax=Murinocardiopsis flavida TaxID=645275 RepID=A0A2P8CT26_9ACTN|nr:MFS transporter [Murinocardiopsis flavida]PSK88102.1 putative MFS family arabinose efflux permease [Murinocardiopsis flavida]